MASRSKTELHPKLVDAYNKAAEKWDKLYPTLAKPFLTATFRSCEEQNSLYAAGRWTKGPKVTNCKGGQSAHNFNPSFAFDVAFIGLNKKLDWNKDLFKKFAALVKAEGGVTWGGDFRTFSDMPHFEVTGWETMKKKPV